MIPLFQQDMGQAWGALGERSAAEGLGWGPRTGRDTEPRAVVLLHGSIAVAGKATAAPSNPQAQRAPLPGHTALALPSSFR